MPVDDAARLRCLHALEAWGVDGVLLAVAARGLLSAPSAPVRIACAQVLQRHGDKRHEVVVSNVLRLELPATVREAAAKALFEVRRRPEKKWEEILPMPDDPLPLAPELPVVRPRGWRLRKQDLLAVALALAVVGAVILVVLFAR